MLTLPKVKGDLIRSIGNQMLQDKEYLAGIEQEFVEENPELAQVCQNSIDTVETIMKNEHDILVAKTMAYTVTLLMYQALKQQQICDELA